MEKLQKFYINGEWVDPLSEATMTVLNPATEQQIGIVALGNAADVDRAVTAANAAFEGYSQTSKEERLALLKGLDESVLERIAHRLRLTEGAEHLIRSLKALGYRTAILSGGFTYFARHLQRKLGIDYVYANELEIENGKVTGRVSGEIVDGKRKAELLLEIARKEHIAREQVIAVGDGANDLPMLSQAGLGVAFRAKPVVKESTRHPISTLGLDAILYLIGFRESETNQTLQQSGI